MGPSVVVACTLKCPVHLFFVGGVTRMPGHPTICRLQHEYKPLTLSSPMQRQKNPLLGADHIYNTQEIRLLTNPGSKLQQMYETIKKTFRHNNKKDGKDRQAGTVADRLTPTQFRDISLHLLNVKSMEDYAGAAVRAFLFLAYLTYALCLCLIFVLLPSSCASTPCSCCGAAFVARRHAH